MQPKVIQRILGLLLMVFSFSMVPPAAVGLYYNDGEVFPFIDGFMLVFAAGLLIWWPSRRHRNELKLRDGFVVVVMFWLVLGLSGAVPLYLADNPELSLTDAVFESISGLTTTGATTIVGLDSLPRSILLYRQELQWLGGMGIVVLAVALLPLLGVGGMQLYKAEMSGPIKDNRFTARISETAKALWYIYLGLTVSCVLLYHAFGMPWFDAIGHAFSTVAIGGFSTHDAGFGHYDTPMLEVIATVFMAASGVSFALHFLALRSRSLGAYLKSSEFKLYASILIGLILVYTLYLWLGDTYRDLHTALRYASFNVVSYATTTGFATADITLWPTFLPVVLILASFVGACAGSTGGGLKVVRFLLLIRQGFRELTRLLHPNATMVVKIGGKIMPDEVISAVWGFFSAYVGIFVILMILMLASGLDHVSAFGAVAATLNNLGPGLGVVASNFTQVSDFGKWVACAGMLFGRLEIFTLLVLFTPAFWRR
ncbi:MAG: TrkH family potassium uptake protein [Halothiobacillaceae bacterium]|nr:TrkH family potassium uptake protein [Halothiobacillaceae bacterium]